MFVGERDNLIKMPIITKKDGDLKCAYAGLIVVAVNDNEYTLGVIPTRDPATGFTKPFWFRTVESKLARKDLNYDLSIVNGQMQHKLSICGDKRVVTVIADDDSMTCTYESHSGTKKTVTSKIINKYDNTPVSIIEFDDKYYRLFNNNFTEVEIIGNL